MRVSESRNKRMTLSLAPNEFALNSRELGARKRLEWPPEIFEYERSSPGSSLSIISARNFV